MCLHDPNKDTVYFPLAQGFALTDHPMVPMNS